MTRRFITLGLAAVLLLAVIPAWGLDVPAVTAAAKGPNQINLTWGAVSSPGYGYRVEIQSYSDTRYSSWTDISTTQNGRNYIPYWVTESQYRDPQDATSGDGTACQFPIYGLMNNTSYSFRVRSYGKSDSGSDAYSSYSNTASATTANYALRYVSTSGNNANDGKTPSTAWRNISYAGQTATAGMVVYVMGGSYANDYLNTANSGSMGNKIVFQAYPGNTVMLTSGSTSGGHNVQINGSYIVVDGIKSNHDSVDYAWANYGSRNAVVNCESGLQGTTQRAGMSTLGAYNIIHNSFFHDGGTGPSGNDPGYICSVMGAGANHNVIQFNHLARGAHDTGLNKNGANYNKWMNNLHDGGWGLGWECVSDSGGPCMYNLFEGNEVANMQKLASGTYKPGLEVSGDYNTIRRNVIRDGALYNTLGIEISKMVGYGASGNLIYNNVIFRNGGMAINFFSGASLSTNLIANNIIYANGLLNSQAGNQIFSEATGAMNVKNNIILYRSSSGVDNPNYGVIVQNYGTPMSVATANSSISGFTGNLTINPGFVNEATPDLHLKSTSGAVAAGTVVTDSVWGSPTYPGAKPSIGAYEYFGVGSSSGGSTNTAPAAPKNLRIMS